MLSGMTTVIAPLPTTTPPDPEITRAEAAAMLK
jgi:hypothetical protein